MAEKERFEDQFPFMRARRSDRPLVYTYATQQWEKKPGQLPDDFFDRPGAISQILRRRDNE